MRNFLIPLAAAAATMAVAAPASAQWYPQPQPYPAPYAAPNAHGNLTPYAAPYARGNFASPRSLQARVQNLRMHVRALDRQNMLTRNQARSFERSARSVERQIRRSSRYGLRIHEYRAIDRQLVQLERSVQRQLAVNMRRGYGHAYGYGYGPRYDYGWR